MTDQSEIDLAGKVAVITGGASGIGLALAVAAARKGMKVALADLSEERLKVAKETVEAAGARTITVRTDVSKLDDVVALRDAASQALGDPWLVANNAGITKLALSWDHSEADWKRMFDINVGGVVNGLLAFLPGLRERKSGHILNTASAAGLITIPAASAYVASKHAVVGLSETLYRELLASHSGVGVSVLCPALVKTNIMKSETTGAAPSADAMNSSHAMEPGDVANQVFDAIATRQFWILTHAAHMEPYIRSRTIEIVSQLNPSRASIDPDVARSSTAITGVDFLAST
ncbi:SDR family NAD(P)-dependent oxidoreductase [Mesorhizobium sp. BH1-1-5]|uniref:SDR family NAD(P)-dependent oxidoreductase n=1 Tax=Mesorhizobium sp. BH1-1-5 TaxID=2876661 RepID=UPI001CCEACD3|nr:SDR family NAD(P)-dependent oxidoreductase [Mesorhizobium sp. BH1-1-5]MBZ9988166.1 SDR family NAD(P)-dependent oxidoreductase [Mesorhizobium sp. BH1-1-5]